MKKLAVILALSLLLQSVVPVSATGAENTVSQDVATKTYIETEDTEKDSVSEQQQEEMSVNNDISENDISANDISANDISANDISANDISANDISANDVSFGDLDEEDYSAIISDYEKNATTLSAVFQKAYYFSQGSVNFFTGMKWNQRPTTVEASDVYYTVDNQTYAVGTVSSSKVYYSSSYHTLTLGIDSFQVDADPDLSRDIKLYFTIDGVKYKVNGNAKFIDESKSNVCVYQSSDFEYFSSKKGSRIQKYSECVTTYEENENITKMELVPHGSDKVVSQGKLTECYVEDYDFSLDCRYEINFDEESVYLYGGIIPKETHRIFLRGEFTNTTDLEEGYYDVLFTAEDGTKYRVENRYYATGTSNIWGVSQRLNGIYQTAGDYIAVYIYGLNINENTIPSFYDSEGKPVSAYDKNDSCCGYEPGDEWGGYWVVKKTEAWEKDSCYSVKFHNGEVYDEDLFLYYWDYCDINLVESTGEYVRAYINGETGIKEGDVLTWTHSVWEYVYPVFRDDASIYTEKVKVQKNLNGLYVEAGEDSDILKAHSKGAAQDNIYEITLKNGDEEVGHEEIYPWANRVPEIKEVCALLVPSGCTWEIHPINQVACVLYSGESTSDTKPVLTYDQMEEVAKIGSVRVCIYDADDKMIDRYYAHFTSTYQITYELNGGVNNKDNPDIYKIGDTITLKDPTKECATFGGWYSDAKLTNKVNGIKASDRGDKTFYAKWIPYTYKIVFDANGGLGTMKSVDCSCGTPIVLPGNSFTKKGYAFVGWSTVKESENGIDFADKATVQDLVKVDKGSITLYAQWEIANYSIIYHTAGGVNASENVKSYTFEDEVTFLAPTADMSGVSFKGWYKENTYKTPITGIEKGSTGDIHVYAKWEVNTYTITLTAMHPQVQV